MRAEPKRTLGTIYLNHHEPPLMRERMISMYIWSLNGIRWSVQHLATSSSSNGPLLVCITFDATLLLVAHITTPIQCIHSGRYRGRRIQCEFNQNRTCRDSRDWKLWLLMRCIIVGGLMKSRSDPRLENFAFNPTLETRWSSSRRYWHWMHLRWRRAIWCYYCSHPGDIHGRFHQCEKLDCPHVEISEDDSVGWRA